MNTTPILRATNIVKKLGGKTILNDVSLDVHKGDVKVVIGPSGAGKSTFLQCLNYLLPPDSGDIWLEGKKVNARDTRELCALRQQVAYLEDSLDSERNFSSRLLEGVGVVLDFLDRHLPEQFRPLIERARELLPVPELQQPEQEQDQGHTWGGMEL